MRVDFRECDFFNLWIWLKFETVPSDLEKQYVDEVFSSWFFLGKLGAFNTENLQVQDTGLDISYLPYDQERLEEAMVSVMHNMADVEYDGFWARCWFDLGTSDALALDILINALKQLSQEYVVIEQCIVGGENPDWPIPGSGEPEFVAEEL